MKLKAQEIYNMYDAINALSQETTSMPTAFYIARNSRIIKEEASAIDEARQKLLMELAAKKEDGSLDTQENGMIRIDDNRLPLFNEEMNKLFNTEIEISIRKIPLSALDKVNLPINSVEVLLPIIEDDLMSEDCENIE